MKPPDGHAYDRLGVSAGKEGVHAAVARLDKGLFPSAFAKILPDLVGGDPAYCNVIHADTVGTKAVTAYLHAKETGDASALRRLPIDSIQMNLGDLACIGAVGDEPIVLSNVIGRNKGKVDDAWLAELIAGTKEHLELLRSLGVRVESGGGETADVGDVVRTLDVGHTAFVRMPREKVIVADIREGDLVVGLSSAGQAAWEDRYNSGIGANGSTLARHGTLRHAYAERYPESVDPDLPPDAVFRGGLSLTDRVPGLPVTVGEALLSPTRTYLPVLRRVLRNREGIHALIHCTGGGQTKVGRFLPEGLEAVKDNLPPLPPVFRMIQEQGGVSWREMYRVFNCGNLLELYVSPDRADGVIADARACGVDAQVVGHCRQARQTGIRVTGEHGEFLYPTR